jgi:oligoendopeptidase F
MRTYMCGFGMIVAALGLVDSAAASDSAAKAVDAPYTWDLDRQYPNDAAWATSLQSIQRRLVAFQALRDKSISNARMAADRLDEVRWLRGRAGHMARFATLHHQVDDTDAVAQQRMDAAMQLEIDVDRGVAWVDTLLLANGIPKLREWVAHEPRLAAHGWHLNRLFALADHMPLPGTEIALAGVVRATQSPTMVYDALMQADLGWPEIKRANGSSVKVDADAWAGLGRDGDAGVRAAANRAFLKRIVALEEPLGLLLTKRLSANLDLAHSRHYPDAIDAFFNWNDGVPAGSYRQLIAFAHSHRDLLDHYVRVVARANGIATPNLGDLDLPMKSDTHLTIPETVDYISNSWSVLGGDYQATARARLALPHIDLAPRAHKAGVGVYWGVGGGDPYTVLSFNGDLASGKTLAEAAALIMFYTDIPPAKTPEERESDWPIYGNAIWFLGQIRLDDEMRRHAVSKAERIAILYDDCRRLWSHFFAYAIYVELEHEIYASIESSKPMSGSQIAARYISLLRESFSPDVLKIDDEFGARVLLDGNAYYGEVLAEWAFARVGAEVVSERVDAGDAAALEALRHPLGKPDSFTSYELLRDAGVDLATPQPYEVVARRFGRLLDTIDRELDPQLLP